MRTFQFGNFVACLAVAILLADPGLAANKLYQLDATQFPCEAYNARLYMVNVMHEDPTDMAAKITLTRGKDGMIEPNRFEACGDLKGVVRDYNKTVKYKDDEVSCDEFPYASTVEGGEEANAMVSLLEENSAQGRDLNTFYSKNKIVATKEFDVTVINWAFGDKDKLVLKRVGTTKTLVCLGWK